MKTKKVLSRQAIKICFLLIAGSSIHGTMADWKRIGLEGVNVTAIAAGKVFNEPNLFAGTDKTGVFRQYGNIPFMPMNNSGIDPLENGPNRITAICLAKERLWVGSDSGLYMYAFTSGLPPKWGRISEVHGTVSAIAERNDTLFAATHSNVFRSFWGNNWQKCDLPFLASKKPLFTSLAFWNNRIAIGSDVWIGGMAPWFGVAYSGSNGEDWTDFNSFVRKQFSAVLALCSYSPRWDKRAILAAGTDSGVYLYNEELHMPIWEPFEPELDQKAHSLYCTNYSWAGKADLFAATDTGLFILSDRAGTGWVLSLKKRVSNVTSHSKIDPAEWFAGAEDGVYCYTHPTSVQSNPGGTFGRKPVSSIPRKIFVTSRGILENNSTFQIAVYLPNGKQITTLAPKAVLRNIRRGVYCIKRQ